MPDPIQKFEANILEVKRLREIHKSLTGNLPGRKHNVEVLNKSAVVLLVACWEAFVEDLATAAFNFVLANAADHTSFPNDVLALSSRRLKAAADNREVWRLAGTGWRDVLVAHKDELFKDHIGKLNTPKPKQIDSLFASLLGIPSLSVRWRWHNVPAAKNITRLNELIELRGAIAHRVAASKAVHRKTIQEYLWFIYRLATISSNRTRAFVFTRTKIYPWPSYKFRNTR
jgi:hypothetical protein